MSATPHDPDLNVVPDDDSHAYARLTPDVVLDALASVGLWGDGRLTALASYENRVYQAVLEDGDRVVLKFYRPGRWSRDQILEEHAFSAELTAAEVPAVPPLVLEGATLHSHAGFDFSVSPWRGGRPPELDDFEVLEWTGRFLARIHTVGAARPFAHRPALDLASFGHDSMQWLLDRQMIPLEVESTWKAACQRALDLMAPAADGMSAAGHFGLHSARTLRLHGDCHPGNVLWTPLDDEGRGGPHFVDLDDARTGPAVQDLWMLLSGDRGQRTRQLGALLDGYEQFRPFDRRELALIEPLRTLRLIHYSAWLARRQDDPIFAINFPWFGTPDYWRGQVDMLNEQIEAMQEEPLYA
ncbi:serine/threonine protein kinase [Delftia sp. SD018]|mgnify:FL=1|uniref:Stress response kinase A n=1 Tax=Chryseobacterium sp. B5 TaxID=2050562 RepID=A0A2G7TC83_9FLAO|nr:MULTISPECIES: serine/threonine protein kinase [Delftia]MBD9582239.1 serine/threonine protein kinase [Delftia sp. DLF01]MBO0989898.1 serine/threonine protein kinase [Delftia sp. SD083]MBO1033609.1 serine/threonine protein kinase [Delftia sp. SD018]MCA1067960.1 Serine/threonine protein kinase RdoA [Delftia acidovorans]PJO38965.1 serine/threonine protein kinase [Delftia acidovorans]